MRPITSCERLKRALMTINPVTPGFQTSCRPWSSYALFGGNLHTYVYAQSFPSARVVVSAPTPRGVDPSKLPIELANTLFVGGNSQRL
jgi:hypothetical protein